MSSNSQPGLPILMHSPMFLNAFSFFKSKDNVICQALLDSWGELGNPCTIYMLLTVPLDTLTITKNGRTSHVQPLCNACKNWITQFWDMYDHCNSQTTWSDHNIFDLTSSHFDSYCFSISHNHDWSPLVLPLQHCTYAPTCHQVPLVSAKCSDDGEESGLSPVLNTFLRTTLHSWWDSSDTSTNSELTHIHGDGCVLENDVSITMDTEELVGEAAEMMDMAASKQQNNDILSCQEGCTSLETPWHQPKPWLGVSLYWTNCGY